MNTNDDKRILVVDDEQSVLMVVNEVLTDEGYQVTTVTSAEEALSLYEQQPFQIVITDIRMGDMDGIELASKVRDISKETEVIIMTSHASMDSVIAALRTGVYDYLIKPFEDLDVITAVVNRAKDKVNLTEENKDLVKRLKINNEKLIEANELLRELVTIDSLTGLSNHGHFQNSLALEISRCERHANQCSVLFLDLDKFKNYNDIHGHMKGDDLLVDVANMIKNTKREADLAARYGGDEFVLILPQTTKKDATLYGEKLRILLAETTSLGKEGASTESVTVSIGVATYPEDGPDKNSIIHAADNALYKAKESGRDRVV